MEVEDVFLTTKNNGIKATRLLRALSHIILVGRTDSNKYI